MNDLPRGAQDDPEYNASPKDREMIDHTRAGSSVSLEFEQELGVTFDQFREQYMLPYQRAVAASWDQYERELLARIYG